MREKVRVIIDFDGTIVDSLRFWRGAIEQLGEYGIEWDKFLGAGIKEKEERLKSRDGQRERCYSLNNHLKILCRQLGINDTGKVLEFRDIIFNFFRQNTNKFLYPDAVDFIDTHHKNKELFLLTSGNFNQQSAKLAGSGLTHYFKKIVITKKEKGKSIASFTKKNYINIFIDDSPSQINSVFSLNSEVITIWLNRKNNFRKNFKREKSDLLEPIYDYKARNFYEIEDILSEIGITDFIE